MTQLFAVEPGNITFNRKISMFETSKPIYIGIAVFITLAFLVSLLLYRQSINIIIVLLPGLVAAATFGVLAWRLGIQNRELRNTIREKEEALLRLQTTSHRSLEHLNRLFHFTSALNDSVVHAKDERSLYEDVCRIACKTGKFRLAWIGLVSEEEQCVIPVTSCGESAGYVEALGRIPLTGAPADGPVLRLIRTGEFVKCNDIAHDPMYKTWARLALSQGYRSAIFLPIRKQGKVVGSLNLYSADSFVFDEAEEQLLVETTNNISFVLDKLDRESRGIARESSMGTT